MRRISLTKHKRMAPLLYFANTSIFKTMKTINKTIAGMLFLVFTGCSGVPLTIKSPENNNTYNVEYLFEYEGCKVYRFYDRGEYIYFTNCQGDVTSFASDSTKTRIENHVRIVEAKQLNAP